MPNLLNSTHRATEHHQPIICLNLPKPATKIIRKCPSNYTPSDHSLNILQLNINGLQKKTTELSLFLKEHNIHIAALQETKMDPARKLPTIPNYTIIRADRTNHGGGLSLLVHHNIPFKLMDIQPPLHDQHMELQAIQILLKMDRSIS